MPLFCCSDCDCRFVTNNGGQLPDFETREPITVALDPL
jgi:hypothetical protein